MNVEILLLRSYETETNIEENEVKMIEFIQKNITSLNKKATLQRTQNYFKNSKDINKKRLYEFEIKVINNVSEQTLIENVPIIEKLNKETLKKFFNTLNMLSKMQDQNKLSYI